MRARKGSNETGYRAGSRCDRLFEPVTYDDYDRRPGPRDVRMALVAGQVVSHAGRPLLYRLFHCSRRCSLQASVELRPALSLIYIVNGPQCIPDLQKQSQHASAPYCLLYCILLVGLPLQQRR